MTNELTDVRCSCGDEYPADSYDAGFIAGSGMCQNCDAALPPKDICTCPSGDGSLRHPCPAHPASVDLAGVAANLTFINGRPAMCGCQVEYSSGGGEYSDVIYVTLCAKHSGSAILDLVATNRIALTPEYEGQWHADLYLDREIPLAKAEGATPAEAVLALMSAERIDPEQESVEQAGGGERDLQAEGAQGEREAFEAAYPELISLCRWNEEKQEYNSGSGGLGWQDGLRATQWLRVWKKARAALAQPSLMPPDRGPWHAVKWDGGRRVDLSSDDFEHDVALTVSGDFVEGDKFRYAQELAAWMNAHLAQPSPVQAEQHWPKLEKPAQVGGVRFSAGVSSRLVVEAAQRLYEFESTPEQEAERIERLQAFREQLDPLNLAPHAEAFNEAPAEALKPEQAEAELDFSRPLETENGEPVKWICADVIEYKSARVCVAKDTGLVYSSPYIGLKIRNVMPEQAEAERPEVVAYRTVGRHAKHQHPHFALNYYKQNAEDQAAHWRERGCEVSEDELMTVAQHERITAQLHDALDESDGDRWKLRSERDAALARVAELDKQCRDDVARALGLRPSQERGFAWSYLLASIKSCVKASEDAAQAQHSVPDVLFDGAAVYAALDDRQRMFTSPENVSVVLDAVVRVVRAAAPTPSNSVPQAWLDVQAERRRQITAEGWTPEHDDEHSHGQMARAAACYALAGSSAPNDGTAALLVSLAWPWDEQWWKPTTVRRDLVKACALGLAEIERLDRAAAPGKEVGHE